MDERKKCKSVTQHVYALFQNWSQNTVIKQNALLQAWDIQNKNNYPQIVSLTYPNLKLKINVIKILLCTMIDKQYDLFERVMSFVWKPANNPNLKTMYDPVSQKKRTMKTTSKYGSTFQINFSSLYLIDILLINQDQRTWMNYIIT